MIVNLITETFGPDASDALKVAKCESGLNPNAVGDGHLASTKVLRLAGDYGESVGIFQIRLLPGRPHRETLLSYESNIKYAKQLFDRQGWGPWSCKKAL